MSRRASFTHLVILGAMVVVVAGCGGGGSTAASSTNTAGASTGATATTTAGATSGGGRFRSGHATIVIPSETIDVALESGSFVGALGSHGSVSVNWADSDDNDVSLLGDGDGGYKLSVIGRAAPNGITQNDCTATVTKDQPSGVEGSYTCGGNITGLFEAH